MGRRSANVEILNRRTILGPARSGPQKEKLFQRQLTLKNISLRQTKLAFQIKRRQDLSMKNDVFDIRRVLGDGVDDGVAKLFALVVPVSFLQVVRRVLHET